MINIVYFSEPDKTNQQTYFPWGVAGTVALGGASLGLLGAGIYGMANPIKKYRTHDVDGYIDRSKKAYGKAVGGPMTEEALERTEKIRDGRYLAELDDELKNIENMSDEELKRRYGNL